MRTPSLNPVYKDCLITTGSQCNLDEKGGIQLVTSPFKVIKFNKFLVDNEYINKLTEDVEVLQFNKKENDLYSLCQTIDLNNVNVLSVQIFLTLLKKRVQPLLGQIFGVKFSGKISATASLYKKGDYLLCHDDKCEDRCVAFVYYLSGGKAKYGGAFEMFDHNDVGQPTNVSVSLPVTQNSFVCFEVGNYSYHQVAEVKSKNFNRLSINGWFHSDAALKRKALLYKDPLPKLHDQVVLQGLVMLEEFINLSYCTPSNLIHARKVFENQSYILLPTFLSLKFYKTCSEAFHSYNIVWKKVGPANRRNYEIADEATLPQPLETLINLFKSSLFVSYLRNISSLSLEPFMIGGNKPNSKFTLEVQRWKAGSYTVATDDEFFKTHGLDAYIFFNSQETLARNKRSCGFVNYLATDDDLEDNELLNIEPMDNALSMVYRTESTIRFSKYINQSIDGCYHCLCATYFESEDN